MKAEGGNSTSEWGTTEYLLAGLTLALVYYWLKIKWNFRNLPPGPRPLPIIGNLHQVKGSLLDTYNDLRKKFGDIFTFYLCGHPAVILNNPKLIREAFNDPAFSGRATFMPPIIERNEGKSRGVILSDKEVWAEQRRFALKTLRDFGFGKKSMESLVMEEVTDLIETFKKSAGKPIQTKSKLNAAVFNALWQLLAGSRFSHDDPEFKFLIDALTTSLRSSGSIINVLGNFSSFFYFLSVKLPRLLCIKVEDKFATKVILEFVRKHVIAHKETFQPDAVPRDFIDVYLAEANKPGTGISFQGEEGVTNLIYTLLDLFIAGAETSSTTLTWLFLMLALNPKKQEKLQEEIDRVVGKSRLPCFNDRSSMPYTEATIMEVLRYSCLIPHALFHTALEDKTFHGYDIPKGTIITPNLFICMRDPEIWGDPDTFRPERFLSSDAKTVVKHEALLPFSVGKRVCLGEALARDELFLFTTSLCQRFKITQDPNGVPLKVEYTKGVVLIPKPFEVILYDRYEEN